MVHSFVPVCGAALGVSLAVRDLPAGPAEPGLAGEYGISLTGGTLRAD